METFFASPERTSPEKLNSQIQNIQAESARFNTLDYVPELVMVLNSDRQLVFGNKALLSFVKEANIKDIASKRPGEILNCIHATIMEGGCGTSEFCKTCGAAKAILNSQSGLPDVQECRIIQQNTGIGLDLRIWTSQLQIGGENYTLTVISDISDEKRRKALERIFYHDILNTAGSLKGVADLFLTADAESLPDLKSIISQLSGQLIDEIKSQQMIYYAEEDDLIVENKIFELNNVVSETVANYQKHNLAFEKFINFEITNDVYVKSDKTILKRIIGNMIKNALEASSPGETVKVYIENCGDKKVKIVVNNCAFMPKNIQLQIFKRSFSTKGQGRGLGTYSIKLLTEKYLSGTAGFESTLENGTSFYVELNTIENSLS